MESFSQFGQDVHLMTHVYPNKKNGYFVEIGAHDGVNMSNTLLMENEFEWRGLCIEPNPRNYAKLVKARKCQKSPYAVYNVDDVEVDFMDDPKGGCSGIADTATGAKFPIIKVKTKKLTTLLQKHNAPRFIEYLSIDTEGSEYDILAAHDFEKYRFGYICVEHNFIEENRVKIRKLLESKGYQFARTNHVDDEYIYIRKRGLFLNSKYATCSIHESGRMCFHVLRTSNQYTLDYAEGQPADLNYDFLIVNYHYHVNNWLTPEIAYNFKGPIFAIVTEVGLNNIMEMTPRYFDYILMLDPTIQETSHVIAFPRPLDVIMYQDPTYVDPLDDETKVPIIGSFGFATVGKRWDLLVEQVNKEFDEAIIRIHIPFATYVPDNEAKIQEIKDLCMSKITKPGIQLQMTNWHMSRNELVAWCSQHTINCFFYYRDNVMVSGLAAVTDQAVGSGRPVLVTKDKTFRHIHPYVSTYPDISIREAIKQNKEGVGRMQEAWSPQNSRKIIEQLLKNY